jgi:hypothetical protein
MKNTNSFRELLEFLMQELEIQKGEVRMEAVRRERQIQAWIEILQQVLKME